MTPSDPLSPLDFSWCDLLIRSIWTEIASFFGGLSLALIPPVIANDGFGTESHLLGAAFWAFVTYLLIFRMIRNRTVSLVLSVLGIAYWTGLIAGGVGLAYIVFGGFDEWSAGKFAYMLGGAILAFLTYRGRAAFGARASDFPTI